MTSHAVSFTVLGTASAKGSVSAFPFKRKDGTLGAVVTDKTKSLKGWETAVRSAAQQQCGDRFFEGSVRLAVAFFLPRPKSLPMRVKAHLKKPDLSKLLRAIEDAITGVLFHDDAQIGLIVVSKGYAITQPHVRITVDVADPVEEVAVPQDLFALAE